MRVVRLRFGIILDKESGALPALMRSLRFGVGGRLGSGQQWMSWITLHDAVGAIRAILEQQAITGPVNIVAPQPSRNADFAQALAHATHRSVLIPIPAFVLKFAMGEMADSMLLASQRVLPSRLAQMRYNFSNPDLPDALASILHEQG